MSRLIGSSDDDWSLRVALDELIFAARRAAQPGKIWLAGLFYPSLSLGMESMQVVGGSTNAISFGVVRVSMDEGFSLLLSYLFLLVIYSRLSAGLARLSSPSAWDAASGETGHPALGDCWRAGHGLTSSVLGMRLSITFLRVAILLLMYYPAMFAWNVVASSGQDGFVAILLALCALPALSVLLIYNLLLSVLLQLGLHSLVNNRRGVASALVHAWRLLRHQPWAAARALAGEFVLMITVLVIGIALSIVSAFLPLGGLIALITVACVSGIAGVTRAGYWSQAYRALGGLTPDDGVPGLDDEARVA